MAAAIMVLHYELLVETYNACPLPMLVGESETGIFLVSAYMDMCFFLVFCVYT